MNPEQIAAQTYTVREHTQTAQAFAETLRKLHKTGYRAVELSGVGSIKTPEIARILEGEGMTCCASHESEDLLFGNPQEIVERMQTLKCPVAVYPWPGERLFDSFETVRAFALKLNETGRILRQAGITFCYHNHHIEFARIQNRTALEVLFAETDPQCVQAELDTYWVQFGGGNPVAWCERLKGRLVVLHMKDYAVNAKREVVFAEVGNGNLDWPSIIAAADAAGCRWFAVEQDTCPADPFESLRVSYEYILQHLCAPHA